MSNSLNRSSTLYIRIVPQDRQRGYMLLASWVKPVIQKTSMHMTTMSVLTRDRLNATIADVTKIYEPGSVVDVTPVGIHAQLRKLFGESNKRVKETV